MTQAFASFFITAALAVCSLNAQAARIVGYVRDADTQRYLYTEVHEQTLAADGAVQTGVTTYYDAQGKEIARKTLDYRANRTVPVYRMDIPAAGYAEGISSNSPQAVLFKRDKGDETRKTISLDDGLVAADAGFNQLLQDQLGNIRKGETVKFNLIVAGRTDRFSFRAKRIDEQQVDGATVMRVLVEPDSLLRLLVSPISLSYDVKTRRLMSYDGTSNILDPQTGKVYKHISITYGGTPPAEARLPTLASTAP
jgi:hypothetical protein